MGATIYRKPEAPNIRGLCVICSKRKQKEKSNGAYGSICGMCEITRWGMKTTRTLSKDLAYRRFKKDTCERCSFKAVDKCQLDVHHKDGDHSNGDPSNLETLCANCHRLEHKHQWRSTEDSNLAPLVS